MLDGLMQGADRDLVKVWDKMNKQRFDNVMLKTKTVGVEAKPDGIYVKFEGEGAPAEPQRYDPCWCRWAAARTARRSAPRRPAWL
jgi:dihydrolipoamide dehydrogenase